VHGLTETDGESKIHGVLVLNNNVLKIKLRKHVQDGKPLEEFLKKYELELLPFEEMGYE
jgi:hypothetical protein